MAGQTSLFSMSELISVADHLVWKTPTEEKTRMSQELDKSRREMLNQITTFNKLNQTNDSVTNDYIESTVLILLECQIRWLNLIALFSKEEARMKDGFYSTWVTALGDKNGISRHTCLYYDSIMIDYNVAICISKIVQRTLCEEIHTKLPKGQPKTPFVIAFEEGTRWHELMISITNLLRSIALEKAKLWLADQKAPKPAEASVFFPDYVVWCLYHDIFSSVLEALEGTIANKDENELFSDFAIEWGGTSPYLTARVNMYLATICGFLFRCCESQRSVLTSVDKELNTDHSLMATNHAITAELKSLKEKLDEHQSYAAYYRACYYFDHERNTDDEANLAQELMIHMKDLGHIHSSREFASKVKEKSDYFRSRCDSIHMPIASSVRAKISDCIPNGERISMPNAAFQANRNNRLGSYVSFYHQLKSKFEKTQQK